MVEVVSKMTADPVTELTKKLFAAETPLEENKTTGGLSNALLKVKVTCSSLAQVPEKERTPAASTEFADIVTVPEAESVVTEGGSPANKISELIVRMSESSLPSVTLLLKVVTPLTTPPVNVLVSTSNRVNGIHSPRTLDEEGPLYMKSIASLLVLRLKVSSLVKSEVGSTLICPVAPVLVTTSIVPCLIGFPFSSLSPIDKVQGIVPETSTKLDLPLHVLVPPPIEDIVSIPPSKKKGNTFLIMFFFVKIVKE